EPQGRLRLITGDARAHDRALRAHHFDGFCDCYRGAGDIDDHVGAASFGRIANGPAEVVLIDIYDHIAAEALRKLEAISVAAAAGCDNRTRTRFTSHRDARKADRSDTLDEHHIAEFHSTLQNRPLDRVGGRDIE